MDIILRLKMKAALALFLLLLSLFANAKEKTLVTVYIYHFKPPFVTNIDRSQGLYFDFTAELNAHSDTYRFETVYVPRKRLERLLAADEMDGILLGVNPVWFNDKQETKYLWTTSVFTDQDEFVSLSSQAFEYQDQHSFNGKILGGVRGFYYFGINELVKDNKVVRADTSSEVDLFSMLLNKRIDTAIISRSTFDYLVKTNNWSGNFHLSKKPHDSYERRILVTKKLADVYQHISPIIDALADNNQWQNTLKQYK